MERVNTGGLTTIEYGKEYRQKELKKKQKEEFEKALKIGRIKQTEEKLVKDEKERRWRKRWKVYNFWHKIKAYLVALIIILIILLIFKKILY